MTAPIVFLDTETTSLRPDRQAWEVAMIRLDAPGRRTETVFTIDVDTAGADGEALAVGGFYKRHPYGRFLAGTILDPPIPSRMGNRQFISPYDAAVTVARWTHGAVLVGSNIGFDVAHLDRLLREHGLLPMWHYSPVDIKAVAAGWLRQERVWLSSAGDVEDRTPDMVARVAVIDEALRLPWSSTLLSEACGVRPAMGEERHTALGDARWVERWHEALMTPGPLEAFPRVSPFQPDPDIMGNAEGNTRILEHDREAAQRFLDQDAADRFLDEEENYT